MLGDYRDIRFDEKHRPDRPLITGLLSPAFVAISAITLLLLGLIIGGLSSALALIIAFDIPLSAIRSKATSDEYMTLLQVTPLAVLGLLVTLITVYALFHKKSRPLALANMALCRTFLILFAAALSAPAFYIATVSSSPFNTMWICVPVMTVACSVGIYTWLLASVAATESNKNKIKFSRALKTSMFLLPILAVACIAFKDANLFPLFNPLQLEDKAFNVDILRAYFLGTLVVYCGWMIYAFSSLPDDKPAFVSRALAGFCLLDACFAATYSLTVPLICLVFFGLSLLLQKIAPAT